MLERRATTRKGMLLMMLVMLLFLLLSSSMELLRSEVRSMAKSKAKTRKADEALTNAKQSYLCGAERQVGLGHCRSQ